MERMERLVIVMPFTRLILTGLFLGVGLVLGIKVGGALLKITAPSLDRMRARKGSK
jgi:hypothetical protein